MIKMLLGEGEGEGVGACAAIGLSAPALDLPLEAVFCKSGVSPAADTNASEENFPKVKGVGLTELKLLPPSAATAAAVVAVAPT
jgi:hypothetical protein